MLCLWSAKGGSGCTVSAAALGLLAARHDETLLVDLGGDVAAALGVQATALPSLALAAAGGPPSEVPGRAVAPRGDGSDGPWFDGADGADGSGPGWSVHGWGIAGWLHAPDPPADALFRFECQLRPGLQLLPWGSPPAGGLLTGGDCLVGGPVASSPGQHPAQGAAAGGGPLAPHEGPPPHADTMPANEVLGRVTERLWVLARLLAGDNRRVVVDLGRGPGGVPGWQAPLLDLADCSVLVSRSCYLGLSRAARQRRPDGVILIDEPGRALRPNDVADALGVPVVAALTWDPAVARAVDAGLLLRRLPRSLRPLEALVDSRRFPW